MKRILLITPLVLWLNFTLGGVATSCGPQAKKNIATAKELIAWLNRNGNRKNKLPASSLSKYFTHNVQFTRNGTLIAQNLDELITNLTNLSKTYPLKPHYMDIIAVNNKVFAYFYNTLSYHNLKQQFVFSELFTFKNGKIQDWKDYVSLASPLL